MKYIIILIVFIVLIIIESVLGFLETKKMDGKKLSETERVKVYKSSILSGIIITSLCIVTALIFKFPFSEMGFSWLSFDKFDTFLVLSIIAYVVNGLILISCLYQMIMYLKSEQYRIAVEKKITNGINGGVDVMLPRTKKEKKWMTLCSATAGIGEEIVYRGFTIYLLSNIFPSLNVYIIIIITAVIFGVLHAYQGVSGTVRTGLIGSIFALLYVATGSLILPIILHFLVDFSGNFLLKPQDEE